MNRDAVAVDADAFSGMAPSICRPCFARAVRFQPDGEFNASVMIILDSTLVGVQ